MKKKSLIFLILSLFLAAFVLMRALQARLPFSLGVDLIPRWVGTQAMLEGLSPYTLEARQRTWQAIYGSNQPPQGNPFGFYYPPAITTLLMPFVLAGIPLDVAAAAWCALLWAAWLLALLAVQPRSSAPGRWQALSLMSFLLSGLFFRPAFSNYILGQTALLGVLALGAAAWLARRQQPAAAGAFLALALLKPSFMLLPAAALLLIHRQRALWLTFFLTLLALNLPSFFLLGWWIPGFLSEISRYALENQVAWSPGTDLLTWVGWLWLALSAALTGLGALRRDTGLILASALALNAALVPHTADYDLVALLGLLLWLRPRLPAWAFYFLLWLPWLTLFLLPDVESWYHFIWLTYPLTLLALTGWRAIISEQLRAEDSNQ